MDFYLQLRERGPIDAEQLRSCFAVVKPSQLMLNLENFEGQV